MTVITAGNAQNFPIYKANITQSISIESIELNINYTPVECDYYTLQRQMSSNKKWKDVAVLLTTEDIDIQYYKYNEEETLTKGVVLYRLTSYKNDIQKVLSPVLEIKIGEMIMPKTDVHKFIYTDSDTENVNLRLVINHSSKIEGGFYNSQGVLIQEVTKSTVHQGLNEFSFDISNIDEGQYLLILKVGGENIIEKIFI